ncbi:serine/threonine-protein kinase [Streptomyces sp. Je 1-79]|uniref:serine/threonine-protein kinase n=1 Tax=Streptomyces sp. Je 1-79 TaxID=2943847 RepID=UPI0021A2F464|nr:serine/threonine-protein kinase [Streptomyces sp. Je 1-79]MCT4355619.1 serine/threonine-protein kinase [Streptomyces sp. Je 1-79]
MLEALPAGQPPRLVGPYRLLARLGAGGMGEVHLACRADAPTADPYRMVAVKTVREDLEVDGDFRTRFRREIVAARAVGSPYAALLVDADADAAVPWLATEYVPGPSLAEAVTRAGALPVDAVRALGAALARALDSVHAAKVLHRDLKPANVLLGASGPKLIDFGIAQAFEATALTSTGLVVGSPGFMSPEHLTGSRAVVPASDVFCLGAVLAFAASGRGPFHDDEMASVIFRISRADAELEGVPAELRPVVERCLRLDPAARPSAAELVELLGSEVPSAFPWPGGVLSLLAEYGDSARRIGEAAASGAGVADLPTLGPQVPYSPTAMTARPDTASASAAASVPAGVKRRRPWAAVAAGAVAVAVLATVGVVMSRDGEGENGGTGGSVTGGGSGPGGATSTPPGAAGPRTLDHVVHPHGGEGHTNDFGEEGADRTTRPAGWSPWSVKVDEAVGPCALSPEVLVCSGDGGGVVALKAADGSKLWSRPGSGELPRPPAQHPAVVGDRVYVTGPDGLTEYGLKDGEERRRTAVPEGGWAVKGTDALDGVLYTTYLNVADEKSGLVTAVKLGDGGKELWRTALTSIPEGPVAAGGQVYVPAGGMPVALDARTGRETARGAGAKGCFSLVVHRESVLCQAGDGRGIAVFDGRTLKNVRTFARDVQGWGGFAVDAQGVVALSDRETFRLYDLATGKERWKDIDHATAEQLVFAGDRLLVTTGTRVESMPLDDPEASADPGNRITFETTEGSDADQGASSVLAAGGALFVTTFDGQIVSGYAP